MWKVYKVERGLIQYARRPGEVRYRRAFPLSRKPHTVIPAQAGIRVGGGARPFCVSQLWKGPGVTAEDVVGRIQNY